MDIIEIIKMVVMWLIGFGLIYLAVKKEYEPTLLLPMGFGAILVNLPNTGVLNQVMPGIGEVRGIIQWLYEVGIEASEAMPILLFIGIGSMIDFEPLLQRPIMAIYGFMAQFGIFVAIGVALLLGFNTADAFSIGIIGAADGPTAILVSQVLKSNYMGPIAVVAYSYMALVPIIQPITIKLITSKKERQITMPIKQTRKVSKTAKIIFPIAVTIIAGFVAPMSISLVGFLMFGNLIRECGVLNTLSKTAQDVLTNLISLLLGITISFSMTADRFLQVETLLIMVIGLVAFVFDTVGGVVAAKIMNIFLKEKINPMIGAAGISAFPMASRVVQKMAGEEKPGNIIIMQAVGANVSGQIASAMIGGFLLGIF